MWLLRGAWKQGHGAVSWQERERGRGEREGEGEREGGDLAPCLPDGCQEAHICL